MSQAPSAPEVTEKAFDEFHLYSLPLPTTLHDGETKQVEFVSAASVPAHTFYVYDASQPFTPGGSPIVDQGYGQTGVTTVANYLEFSTGDDGGLGAALPAGDVRVYQQDTDGSALLIGENSIDHTPKDEWVKLRLSYAFDLKVQRRTLAERVNKDRHEYDMVGCRDELGDVRDEKAIRSEWRFVKRPVDLVTHGLGGAGHI